MYFVSAVRPLSLVIAMCAGAAAALGEAAAPAAPQQAAAPVSPADLQSCLQETGDYVTRGKAVLYVIGLANTCDRRLRCEIYANVTGARGSSLGHTVVVLGATSSGAAAKQTYAMRVKAAGGTAQISRDCKAL